MKIAGAVLEEMHRSRPYAHSRPITVAELELQPPQGGEVLVQIEAAGLCHSDLSVVSGDRPRPTPMLLGHEAAGRVVQLGPDVTDLSIGQRVVMTFLPRCGRCAGCATDGREPCAPGSQANAAGTLIAGGTRIQRDGYDVHHHLGVSGFSTYAVVSRHSVVPVADDVPAHIAAIMGCAVLTGGGAVLNVGQPSADDDVVVVGLGGVGMAALLTARALGARRVIAVDALTKKLHQARELGADEAYSPHQAIDANIRAQIVIEAAGHPQALETAFALTAPGGTTVTVGLPHPSARSAIPVAQLTAEARTIKGSYLGSAVPERDLPKFVDMWRSGRLPIESLISSIISIGEINEALDKLADATELRQIIQFDHT
ncbi:zinc-binding dehydrogenase [Pseudactinotalea sp. Z1748]|uniref:zinc-binding dehydrogenase n=1 Tax=Pseudactinotalea sp. Z1748 TaxID=3413027 RepID=UPI003C7AAC0E